MVYEKTCIHTQPVMYFEDKCDREVFSQNLQPFPSFLPTENWFTEYEWVMRYWEGAQEGKTREYMLEKNMKSLFSPPLYVTKTVRFMRF